MAHLRGNTYIEGTLYVEGGLMVSTVTTAGQNLPYYASVTADTAEGSSMWSPWAPMDNGAIVMFNETAGGLGALQTSRVYIERTTTTSVSAISPSEVGLTDGQVGIVAGIHNDTSTITGDLSKMTRQANVLCAFNNGIKLNAAKTQWIFES